MLEHFSETNEFDLKRPGRTTLRTKEGKKAVEEAIKFLEEQEPRPQLKFSPEMLEASKAHVEDIGPLGLMTHNSSDGSSTKERLNKHGNIISCYGESLSFQCTDAREALCMLLIDDGSRSKG